MAIRIKKSSVDGKTGHFQVTFCVEERNGNQTSTGPDETSGIWPHALMTTYHGPEKSTPDSIRKALNKWLKERHDDALQRKRHIEMTGFIANELSGKLVEFE